MAERVLISGASGFIASHTVAASLDAGFEVSGTVRDPDKPDSVSHLKALPGAEGRLELVRADLMGEGAFDGFTQSKGVGSYLRTHLGRVPRYDSSNLRADLGLELRPTDESLLDTCRDLARWGHVPPPETPA